jgi:hypothetical protein
LRIPSTAEELAAETRNAVRLAFGSRRKGLVVRRDLDIDVASPLAGMECFGAVSHSPRPSGEPPQPDWPGRGKRIALDQAMKMAA